MSAERSAARVLIADDDEDILELVRMVLEEDGYEIASARDGERALALARERPPDLCVLDVMMPKLDGCEVTKALRADEATRNVPILLLSARTQWEAVVRGRDAGADEYMTKPFVPDDLQRSVRGLLTVSSEPDPIAPDDGVAGASVEPAMPIELAPPDHEPEPVGGLVLVASSDENVAGLVCYRLELAGYEVAVARDAEEAAQIALERGPDACVFDPSMPKIDGLPVARIDGSFDVHELYLKLEEMLAGAARRSA